MVCVRIIAEEEHLAFRQAAGQKAIDTGASGFVPLQEVIGKGGGIGIG